MFANSFSSYKAMMSSLPKTGRLYGFSPEPVQATRRIPQSVSLRINHLWAEFKREGKKKPNNIMMNKQQLSIWNELDQLRRAHL